MTHSRFTMVAEFHQNLLHFAVQDGCLPGAAAAAVVYLLYNAISQ